MKVITAKNGTQFRASDAISEALDILSVMPRGGFATARGYISESGRVVPQVADITFVSRFSGYNRTEKELNLLKALSLDSVSFQDKALLEVALAELIASKEKTLSGDRSDARRQAHDTFYAPICEGVKVHLLTEKVGKETHLVLVDGLPVAKSINVMAIEIGRKVISEGEYKEVNSRPKTIAKRAIEKAIRNKVLPLRSLSLQDGKFEGLAIGGTVLTGEEVSSKIPVEELLALVGQPTE